jgi:aryl-alcohol dehydrogenase-like predicted oxidoreductase
MIAPHVNQVVQAITRQATGEIADRWEAWRERYLPELLTLLRGLRREAAERSRAGTAAIAAAIEPLLPESKHRETLSRKALWVLVSTPGVTCVLTGMRTVAYVEDALAVLGWEPVPAVRPIYQKLTEVIARP